MIFLWDNEEKIKSGLHDKCANSINRVPYSSFWDANYGKKIERVLESLFHCYSHVLSRICELIGKLD